MAVKNVNLKDLAKEIGIHTKVSLHKQKQAVGRGIIKGLPLLVQASPVDTGLYANSWDFTMDEERAILGNYAPQAAVIEYGARPHKTPIQPLLEWAKRVLKDPSQPRDKDGTGGYSAQVQALAYATQRKIAEFGQAPLHILEKTLPVIIEQIKEELKRL